MRHDEDKRSVDDRAPTDQVNGDGPEGYEERSGGAPMSSESEILRRELELAQAAKANLQAQLKEADERFLRSRAELDTMRRRMQGEVELARREGIESALGPVFNAYDDLERALDAATKADDPATIVPGVRGVKQALQRNLESIGVKVVGEPGEMFDPNVHEALSLTPLRDGAVPGSIDQVYESGFVQGEYLVRVARVTVFDGKKRE